MGKDTELLNNKKLGDIGERIAKIYLQINEHQILKCNFRSKFGEIDIITRKGNTLHFVEVKTRTSHFIEARLAINKQKQEHIWKTAEYFLYINSKLNILEKSSKILLLIPFSVPSTFKSYGAFFLF